VRNGARTRIGIPSGDREGIAVCENEDYMPDH